MKWALVKLLWGFYILIGSVPENVGHPFWMAISIMSGLFWFVWGYRQLQDLMAQRIVYVERPRLPWGGTFPW